MSQAAIARSAPHPHRFIIFAVVGLALMMSTIDATIVAVGLPAMQDDLHTTLNWVGWTLSGYALAQTIVMPLSGKLCDEFGRKQLFIASVALFTLSSIAAGFAPNIYMLILFRLLQGLGGGVFLPSATGIISDTFGEQRTTAIGMFTTIFPIGSIIGPNVGGLIIDHLSWHWMFFVNGPIGVVMMVMGLRYLPMTAKPKEKKPLDLIGVAFFALALVLILYAMTDWGNNPGETTHAKIWLLFASGGLLLAMFLRHEARTAAPMVELQLLKWRPFLAVNLYNFISGAVTLGTFAFIPLYAQKVYHFSATRSGAVLSPRSASLSIVSVVSSFLLIRFGYRRPMVFGMLLMCASIFLMGMGFRDVSVMGYHIPNVALLAMIVALAGVGMGLHAPASSNAALDLLPDKIAAVAGLRGMFRSTGGVVGTATVLLALSHFKDSGRGLEDIFIGFSVVMLVTLPIIFFIPDIAKARYDKGARATHTPATQQTAVKPGG
ncbi:MAG: DHA2 family efflux MFS transporter permease subunit [Chloroflexi bacterium]|nr:DHA2 family efflux MFS transporter permease subunit [Chloroflexota bacterium]